MILLEIFTVCKRSCGMVMFLHLSVILSTGGCLPQCMAGYTPPWADTPPPPTDIPQTDTPLADIPPGQTHPPPADTPLSSACWDTHGYCGRWYASYWNAFFSIAVTTSSSHKSTFVMC